jgi:transcriptional regulator
MTFYVPGHFRVEDAATLERFVAENGFATLVSTGPEGLWTSHVPLLIGRGGDGRLRLEGHMARANAHWESLESAAEVLAIFGGPHAYVSPSWYAHHPSVPTWNYAVVHARGKARIVAPEALPALLGRLTRKYEEGRLAPWRMEDLPGDFTPRLLAAIVGFEIAVERLEGKFKLSQNRRPADLEGVIAALEREGQGALAALMREHAARPPESR